MLILHRSVRKRLAAALEWPAVDKALILLMLVIPVYVQELLWGAYVLMRDDRDRLVNVDVLLTTMRLQAGLVVLGLIIAGAGAWLRKRRPEFLPYQHLVLHFFALSLVLLSYGIGTVEFPVGLVLLGAPVFGFILLDRVAVWVATLTSLALLIGLSYASAWGWLPYAPVMIPPHDAASHLFWMNSAFFFAAPFFIFTTFMADEMLTWWRDREEKVRQLSRTDGLTGVPNRRHVLELLDLEVTRADRQESPLSLVILDLDHFKKVNDTWGHPTGDRVLRIAAATLQDCLRAGDFVGRYGGEEFLLILPGASLQDALMVAERCRQHLAAAEIHTDSGERLPVTASFGLACTAHGLGAEAQQLIRHADEALYEAKRLGRNRIESVLLPPANHPRHLRTT